MMFKLQNLVFWICVWLWCAFVFIYSARSQEIPQADKWYLVQITKFKNFTRVQFMGNFDTAAACQLELERTKLERISCKTTEMLNQLAAEIPEPGEDI